MSIHGDNCPACASCTKKSGGPNCNAWKSCHDYKIWFSEAWREIRRAAENIKECRDTLPEELPKETTYKT